jgi:unsaturated rhamnogalacturonyl hydrolase
MIIKCSPALLPVAVVLIVSCAGACHAQADLSNWPKGTSPQDVGKVVAEHFVDSPHQSTKMIIYPEVCLWYGSLTFGQLASDNDLTGKLVARFQPLLTDQESALLPKSGTHVDQSMFGSLPLQLYMETHDRKYLDLGLKYADDQWNDARSDGLTKETRFWIDDMYMITIVQMQAYRSTQDKKYLDRAASEMVAYLNKLQQPNGLFFHADDVPFYWGRGDGWVAAGMTEVLRDLPKDHPLYGRIMKGYTTMMASLLKYQRKDGMWLQLLDHDESWPETSSTGMFAFAMITGVKKGWLDFATYAPAARKAWLGLVGYIDQNGNVTSVCEGTNKLNDLTYYIMRRRRTGDFHGQAPVMWAATALLRN